MENLAIFDRNRRLSQKWYEVGVLLLCQSRPHPNEILSHGDIFTRQLTFVFGHKWDFIFVAIISFRAEKEIFRLSLSFWPEKGINLAVSSKEFSIKRLQRLIALILGLNLRMTACKYSTTSSERRRPKMNGIWTKISQVQNTVKAAEQYYKIERCDSTLLLLAELSEWVGVNIPVNTFSLNCYTWQSVPAIRCGTQAFNVRSKIWLMDTRIEIRNFRQNGQKCIPSATLISQFWK